MCLLSTLSGLVDCLDKLSWKGRQFFNTLSSNDTALDNFSVWARDTGEWNLLRDDLLRVSLGALSDQLLGEADFFTHLNKSMSELSFTTLHLEDNMRLKTFVTLVGISSFLMHLSSNLWSSDFSCCGIPLHCSSSMKVIAVSLGTGKIHCLRVLRSAIHSPFKSPQSPVTLSLKRMG